MPYSLSTTMSVLIPIIVAALLAGGGSIGGIAYYDGVFTAVPISELDSSDTNKTITIKGEVVVSESIPQFALDFVSGVAGFEIGNQTFFLLDDQADNIYAFAVVLQSGNHMAQEGSEYVVTGKLAYFYSMSYFGETFKFAFMYSASYHKPILFG